MSKKPCGSDRQKEIHRPLAGVGMEPLIIAGHRRKLVNPVLSYPEPCTDMQFLAEICLQINTQSGS